MKKTVLVPGGLDLRGLSPTEQVKRLQNQLTDIQAPEEVEVRVETVSGRVWINVMGVCMLRIAAATIIKIETDDERIVNQD